MNLDTLFELVKEALEKNLAKYAHKDEVALLGAYTAIEVYQAGNINKKLICKECGHAVQCQICGNIEFNQE